MTHRTPTRLVPPAGRRGRRGFSFVEILFAVMILGIGFIMIAGIFPVAISQTALTQEETVAAATARGAVAAYRVLPNLQTLIPATNTVVRLTDLNWDLVRGNQILVEDPRFGWTALAIRGAPDPAGRAPNAARLIVIPCQVRGRSAFTNNDLTQGSSNTSAHATLMPLPCTVRLKEGYDSADRIQVVDGIGAGAAAAGAVIVLANPTQNDQSSRPVAGRTYRLGNVVDEANRIYELLPGNDLEIRAGTNGVFDPNTIAGSASGGGDDLREGTTPDGSDVTSGVQVDAFIVGRAVSNPGVSAAPTFEGPSIATGVYSTYISLQ
ncbi:MAG: hypothetical protein JWO31_2976 [Phycisphaerales bacterium]|nr:hypothetical protein [Phycisphaerales bacterium]